MSLYTSGRARRSLIDTIAFRLVSQLATVLGYVVLVRGMSKEDFGVLNLLYAFIPVVSTVASLGLEQTLRRYQPEYLSAGNTAAAAWLVKLVASARFVTSVILLGLIVLGWNYVAPFFKLAPYRDEFLILCLLMLIHFQARILELSLASHMLQRYSVGGMAVIAIVKLLAYSLLANWSALTLGMALLADTVAFAVACALMWVGYRRYCAYDTTSSPYRPDPIERRRLIRYGAYNNFNDAGTLFLDSKTDNFFIAAIIDPLSVGIYSFYTRLNEMSQNMLPARMFQNVIQPLFFAIPGAQAREKVPQYFSLLVNLNLTWQLPVLAYAAAFHAEIVHTVFGGKFLEHSWMLPVIAGFAVFNVLDLPVTLVAQYQEKAATMLLSKVFAIYNVAALLLLVPTLGVAGAAIASGSARCMKYLFIWSRVRGLARWTNARIALTSSLVMWGAIVAACLLMKQMVPNHPVLQLCIGIVLVGFGGLAHIRGPALSGDDRRILSVVMAGREAALLRRLGFLTSVPRS